jgi:Heterokaryon incompatibility protein (HET)
MIVSSLFSLNSRIGHNYITYKMKLNYLSKKKNIEKEEYKLDFDDFEIFNSKVEFTYEKYVCVSYAWENLSIKHPFDENKNISNRTLSVLQTACYSYQQLLNINEKNIEFTDKIWIDSICIPSNNAENDLHYFLMGEIYAKSSIVFVILSKELETVLYKVRNEIKLLVNDFELLNQDKWVSRHWTYQEIVNSGRIYLNSEGSTDNPIFISSFFDKIAQDIEHYTNSNYLDTLGFQKKYPFLTSLEAVIIDWRIMSY